MSDTPDILSRVEKLMRLSQNTGATAHEAHTATLMAQKLMAQYHISESRLDLDKQPDRKIEHFAPGEYTEIEWLLATTLAKRFRCRAYRARGQFYNPKTNRTDDGDVIKYVGLDNDATYLIAVHTLARQQLTYDLAEARRKHKTDGGYYARLNAHNFASGWTAGLAKELDDQSARESFTLICQPPPEVDEWCRANLYPWRGRYISSNNGPGYASGMHAGRAFASNAFGRRNISQ